MSFPILDNISTRQHNNFKRRGETLKWSGTDSLARFEENCRDSTKKATLADLGFLDTDINYTYNSYGFRDEEFDCRPCGLALGCSHTEGTGLLNKDTWPRVLSNLTGTWVWNLGVSGSSFDTVFRLLDAWLPYFTPEFVAICIPSHARVEVFRNNNPITLTPHVNNLGLEHYYKSWVSDQHNVDITKRKNLLAIEKLCNDRNIKLIALDVEEIYGLPTARDLMHSGVIEHKRFAEKIKEKL